MNLMFLAVAAGVLALDFAFVLTSRINKQDAGTERMKEIAGSIAEGARAFLFAEYKILVIFAVIGYVIGDFCLNIRIRIAKIGVKGFALMEFASSFS